MRFTRFPRPKYSLILFCLFFSTIPSAFSQLTTTDNYTAAALAAKLAGPGVTVLNPVLTCPGAANGMFVATGGILGLDSGIILTTGTASGAIGAASGLASSNQGGAGDNSLTALAHSNTYDACSLEFDLVPKGDTVKFQYQFGSEEYIHSTCGSYDDAFAFFISGPGITGTENIALVPNTSIPVLVNSINSGIPGTDPGCSISNCTSVGPGSPFIQYYVDNSSGAYLKYQGFTDVLTAYHQVTPCQTYHLKLVIADAGNGLYDSGVFLKANSLKANSFSFDRSNPIGVTVNGTPNAVVKGCAPLTLRVINSGKSPTPQTINFNISGTGINGLDYATIPGSVTIPAGDTGVSININGIATIPSGTKTLHLEIFTPSTCGITDSITLNILDAPSATILTHDTTVCNSIPLQLSVMGTDGLTYSWSPSAGLGNPNAMQPIANPKASTVYTMTATLPNAGCPPIVKTISLGVDSAAIILLSHDTSVCIGTSVPIIATGLTTLVYAWTPAEGLSDPNIMSPIATPTVTTTYTVSTRDPNSRCLSSAQIRISIGNPQSIRVQGDTICEGQQIAFTNPFVSPTSTWYFGDSTMDTGRTISHIYNAGIYDAILVITDTFSCPDSVLSQITVDSMPYIHFTTADSLFCQGKGLVFNGDYRQDGNVALEWVMGDNTATVLAQDQVMHAYDQPGDYTVRFTARYRACSDTFFTSVVKVQPYPIINLGRDTSICPNATPITIRDFINEGNPAASWVWNDGGTGSAIQVSTPGTYYATVTIGGCPNADSILVSNDCYVEIPNAFSPNGDGINDYFFPRQFLSRGLTSFSMNVYNRWGQLVFSSTSTDGRGWDGKLNDRPQLEGAYVYTIEATFKDGEHTKKQGNITLIR